MRMVVEGEGVGEVVVEEEGLLVGPDLDMDPVLGLDMGRDTVLVEGRAVVVEVEVEVAGEEVVEAAVVRVMVPEAVRDMGVVVGLDTEVEVERVVVAEVVGEEEEVAVVVLATGQGMGVGPGMDLDMVVEMEVGKIHELMEMESAIHTYMFII